MKLKPIFCLALFLGGGLAGCVSASSPRATAIARVKPFVTALETYHRDTGDYPVELDYLYLYRHYVGTNVLWHNNRDPKHAWAMYYMRTDREDYELYLYSVPCSQAIFSNGTLVASYGPNYTAVNSPAKLSPAESAVEEMRGLNMQPGNPTFDDGRTNAVEQYKEEIIEQLRLSGNEAVPALIRALKDPDVQMRRNAELVIFELAWGYDSKPVDMRKTTPALIRATGDEDGMVRAWAAMDLGYIGPDAKAAVPALIKLVRNPDEGCRNDACIALGDIGPAAQDALPALRKALNDPSKDTRQFAKIAINKIQNVE